MFLIGKQLRLKPKIDTLNRQKYWRKVGSFSFILKWRLRNIWKRLQDYAVEGNSVNEFNNHFGLFLEEEGIKGPSENAGRQD